MSALTIYAETGATVAPVVRDFAVIAEQLQALGVVFQRWQAVCEFPATADAQTVQDAYRPEIDALCREYGFQAVDVISVAPDHPNKTELRQKFLAEHVHADFEVRFFVAGCGLFYLHVSDRIYAVLCEQGDLISVPAGTRHWFDMGENPDFKCIRLFTTPEGWVAEFTGSAIGESFPLLDQYLAA